MAAKRPKAYSYTRFSTPEQSQGDSSRRQTAAAEAYANANGLELDGALTFRDLGVSAYRGRNAAAGRLGDFLEAVKQGAVPPGSFLLVENLDRISRQTARKALRTLEAIVEAGVTLVTLTDGKAYTESNLDGDPFSLMMAIMTFVRAHEESELKGRRVRAAWENKRKLAVANGVPLTKRTPGWLTLSEGGKLRIDREKAAVVRRIFKMTLDGVGQHAIASTLNQEKVEPFKSDRWHRSYVKKILENPATFGRLVAHRIEYEGGRKIRKPAVTADNHFPAIVTESDWNRIQEMRDLGSSGHRARSTPKGDAPLQNILASLARCPKCEGTMTRVNKGPTGGYPYLVCARAKAGAGCQYVSVRMASVEASILERTAAALTDIPSGDPEADDNLRALDDELELAREKAENVTEAIAARGITGALGDRLRKLEKLIGRLEAQRAKALAKLQDAPLLMMKVEALKLALAEPRPDRRQINALLRQMARAVSVDWTTGDLVFEWKHGGQSRVTYGMPSAPTKKGSPGRGKRGTEQRPAEVPRKRGARRAPVSRSASKSPRKPK